MPRRQPPTSLRLVEGPLPMRGQARHTLPSVPRPALVSVNVSRSLNWSSSARSEPRAAVLSPPGLSHAGRGVGAGSPPVRGPWDHSRVVSLPIDVGSVLPLPKPVAISP
ncbi:hypothetical protein DFH11DRAFT_1862394 [Phellopilus nigrolimitatus]|nr:hypothetical protein DFH11DRAFT_1862394 [Phellopilus nigrolimitatus]